MTTVTSEGVIVTRSRFPASIRCDETESGSVSSRGAGPSPARPRRLRANSTEDPSDATSLSATCT
jgi:hypothetical protein